MSKRKKVTIFLLTSFMMISFCLIPCGKAGLLNAWAVPAVVNHEYAEVVVEMSWHICHSSSSADFQFKEEGNNTCLHCDTSTNLVIQTLKKEFSKDRPGIETSSSFSSGGKSTSHVKRVMLRPPGSDRKIHILNSTFII